MWRVDGNSKTAIPSDEQGKFFDSHCYIVLYTYHGDRKEEFFLCNWLGEKRATVWLSISIFQLELKELAFPANVCWTSLSGSDFPPNLAAAVFGKLVILNKKFLNSIAKARQCLSAVLAINLFSFYPYTGRRKCCLQAYCRHRQEFERSCTSGQFIVSCGGAVDAL